MRTFLLVFAAVALIAPATADAQSSKSKSKRAPTRVVHISRSDDCCWGNRFSLDPYAGAMNDAYDVSPDEENTAYMIGFRIGYHISYRTRVLANIAYSESDDVANSFGAPAYFVYDNTWIFTTAGMEFDVVPGQTSASFGLQGGAAWRQVNVDGSVGVPIGTPEGEETFVAHEVLIPALMLRHRLSNRTTVMAGLHDNIFDFFDGATKHSVALTAGISFR